MDVIQSENIKVVGLKRSLKQSCNTFFECIILKYLSKPD